MDNELDKILNALHGVIDEALLDGINDEVESAPSIKVHNNSVLDPEQARRARMTQVVAKFASTLTLRPIHVSIANPSDAPDAPAWSDSDNIWFHPNHLGYLNNPDTVLQVKGLSLHEVSHILLTPRTGSNLAKDVQREGLWRAFNALEDQRIEMMMTKRFGNVADWLTATVAKFIMDEPEQWSVSFPLLHGRKFLPAEVRKQVRDMYEQPEHVNELADLIDKYIGLNLSDPKNYSTALGIIRRYHELVMELPMVNLNPDNVWSPNVGGWDRVKDPAGHDHRKNGEWKPSRSKPLSKAEQQKLSERVADAVQQDNTNNSTTSDNSPQSDSHGEGDNGDTTGKGASATGERTLSDLAGDLLDNVKQRKARDIANTLRQYGGDIELSSGSADKLGKANITHEPVAPHVAQASKSFATELERLRADYDPGWLRRTESGRLNIQRYVTGTDIDECFDEWDMGREDAVDIEAVILLDVSGSMQDVSKGAFESMWAIKRALDRTNASTTVIAFDHSAMTLYDKSERAGVQMKTSWCTGGTNPLTALQNTRNILAESERAIKLCITITDGVWGSAEESDKLLREFRRANVLTALAFIKNDGWTSQGEATNIDSHGCEIAVRIDDTRDLFTLGRSIVNLGISRNLIAGAA